MKPHTHTVTLTVTNVKDTTQSATGTFNIPCHGMGEVCEEKHQLVIDHLKKSTKES